MRRRSPASELSGLERAGNAVICVFRIKSLLACEHVNSTVKVESIADPLGRLSIRHPKGQPPPAASTLIELSIKCAGGSQPPNPRHKHVRTQQTSCRLQMYRLVGWAGGKPRRHTRAAPLAQRARSHHNTLAASRPVDRLTREQMQPWSRRYERPCAVVAEICTPVVAYIFVCQKGTAGNRTPDLSHFCRQISQSENHATRPLSQKCISRVAEKHYLSPHLLAAETTTNL